MSDDIPMYYEWMGKRLEDMSREELIEALILLCRAQERETKERLSLLDAYKK